LKTTPKQPDSSADIGSHASKNVTSWSDLRYAEENVNNKYSATRPSLPFGTGQTGTACRNEHPSPGLAGQIHSDKEGELCWVSTGTTLFFWGCGAT